MNDSSAHDNAAQHEEFVRHFGLNQGRVFAYIMTLVPSWADAEDVLQRTSLVLWRKFDQFDPSGSFVNWACGVAFREAMKYLRQEGRQRRFLKEAVLEKLAQTRLARADVSEHRSHKVDDCVDKLPDQDREIIQHYYYQGKKTAAQVGEELRRPTNTVLKALIRIRRTLQRCVDQAVSQEDRK